LIVFVISKSLICRERRWNGCRYNTVVKVEVIYV